MSIQIIGSFATVWFLLWFSFALLLTLVYPLLRKPLFKLNRAYASTLILGIIAVPLMFSLLCTVLLFVPTVEALFVSDHCHTDCGSHLPLFHSDYLAWPGFFLLAVFVAYFIWKLYQQVHFAKKLNSQLQVFSETTSSGNYRTLNNTQPLVFTVGWWRNRVYLSEGLRTVCTEAELAIICAHEQAHVSRKDNLRIMAARLLTLMLPRKLVHNLLNDLQLVIESACDEQAASRFGNLKVAETFVKIQRLMPTLKSIPYGVSAINGSPIEARVQALLEQDKLLRPSKTATYVVMVVILVVMVLSIDPLHHLAEFILGLS